MHATLSHHYISGCQRAALSHIICGWCMQEFEEAGLITSIQTMVWAGQHSLVLSCSLHRDNEDAEEVC